MKDLDIDGSWRSLWVTGVFMLIIGVALMGMEFLTHIASVTH